MSNLSVRGLRRANNREGSLRGEDDGIANGILRDRLGRDEVGRGKYQGPARRVMLRDYFVGSVRREGGGSKEKNPEQSGPSQIVPFASLGRSKQSVKRNPFEVGGRDPVEEEVNLTSIGNFLRGLGLTRETKTTNKEKEEWFTRPAGSILFAS